MSDPRNMTKQAEEAGRLIASVFEQREAAAVICEKLASLWRMDAHAIAALNMAARLIREGRRIDYQPPPPTDQRRWLFKCWYQWPGLPDIQSFERYVPEWQASLIKIDMIAYLDLLKIEIFPAHKVSFVVLGEFRPTLKEIEP